MRTTVENLYRNATYSYSELISIVCFGVILGFLFSFNDWGVNGVFNRDVGVSNFLLATIISLFVLFMFTYIQKVIGVCIGVHATHRVSWVYLLISVIVCFATSGVVVFFIPPTLCVSQIPHLSIGRKPFAFSIKNLRLFALIPILILVSISVIISKSLPLSSTVTSALFWVTFLTALYSLIPIEFITAILSLNMKDDMEESHVTSAHKLNSKGVSLGSILLYGSKSNFIFAIVFLISSAISQITTGFLFTILFAFLVAFGVTTAYFFKMEL